jgi:ParB-like chromosome segregation protein Spo0J
MTRNAFDWQTFAIERIKPYAAQARVHNKRQIKKIKKLIRHYGQVIPILIDREGVIVDGHAVWQAMRELGSGEIAAIVVANRTEPEIKALRLALNRIPGTPLGRMSGSATSLSSLLT